MGLFSSKPKKEIKTIKEAVFYDDEKFCYTAKSGHTYGDFPARTNVLQNKNGYWNIDDTWEMYAPRLVGMFENIDANVTKLVEQNQLLLERINSLETQLAQLSETNKLVR